MYPTGVAWGGITGDKASGNNGRGLPSLAGTPDHQLDKGHADVVDIRLARGVSGGQVPIVNVGLGKVSSASSSMVLIL